MLDNQSSEQGKDEVTYFYVGDVFCIYLGTMYANFQEKILEEISGKKFQTFHCNNVTTMNSRQLKGRWLAMCDLVKVTTKGERGGPGGGLKIPKF